MKKTSDGFSKDIADLFDLLREANTTITFDPYRDVTKGCGDHCKGMNKAQLTLCENHMKGVILGDYFVPGGGIDEVLQALRDQRDFERKKTIVLKKVIAGEVSIDRAQTELSDIEDEANSKLPSWAR